MDGSDPEGERLGLPTMEKSNSTSATIAPKIPMSFNGRRVGRARNGAYNSTHVVGEIRRRHGHCVMIEQAANVLW